MFNLDEGVLPAGAEFGEFSSHSGDNIVGKNLIIDFFYNYWLSKHENDNLPSRADIKPHEIKKHLDHIVIMDVFRDQGKFSLRVRLIGTHVVNFYGEITGKDINEIRNQKAASRIYHMSGLAITQNAPQLSITPAFAPDRQYLEAFAIYLPLYDNEGAIEKILVAVDVASRNTAALL